MKKILYLSVIFFLGSGLLGLSFPRKYTIYNDWSNVSLADSIHSHQYSDTLFVVASNRQHNPATHEFLESELDSLGAVRYFLVTFSEGRWLAQPKRNLHAAVDQLPHRDFIVYVEGMGKTFPLNLQRGAAMNRQYNLNVILFDYPSIHPEISIFGNFKFAYSHAESSWVSFQTFLHDVADMKKEFSDGVKSKAFTLMHHSMGNLMLKEMMMQDEVGIAEPGLFDNLVINAACVPQEGHKEWVEKIEFAERIFINYNKQDKQLNGAMILTFKKMLGARPGNPLAENATYVDFNPLVKSRHSNFLNITGREDIPPQAFQYYYAVLHGKDSKLEERTGQEVAKR